MGMHTTSKEKTMSGTSTFYTEAKSGALVWVTSDGRVRMYRATHTSNPHQPAAKWFQVARPKDAAAYAAAKVAAGEWVAA